MEVIGFSLTEHYPAIYIPGKGPIFINYPGVAFKEKHTANWHHLDFAKISPDIEDQNFSHHKYEVEKLPSGEAHETVMNLSVEIDILAKLKKKEKLNDEKAKTPKNEESKVTKEQSEKEEIGIKNKSSSISNSSSSDKEGKESKEISKEKTVINADASKRDAKEIKISSEGSSSSDESNVKRKIEIKLNKKVPTIIHSPKVDIKTKSKKQISESSDEENFRVSAPKIENSKVEPKLTLKLPKQRKSSSSDYSSDIETGTIIKWLRAEWLSQAAFHSSWYYMDSFPYPQCQYGITAPGYSVAQGKKETYDFCYVIHLRRATLRRNTRWSQAQARLNVAWKEFPAFLWGILEGLQDKMAADVTNFEFKRVGYACLHHPAVVRSTLKPK